MCRLLGYAAPRATTAAAVLGAADAREWQRMGRLHADGWGTAWVDDAGDVRRYRDPSDGAESADLAGAIDDGEAVARIAHLRLATEGMGNVLRNTHPFVADGIAFAHNGSIHPVHELRAMVRPEEVERLGGTTDSAIVAALVLREVARGVPLFEATTSTVARLRERFPTSAINLLVLSADELVAVHANEGAPVPLDLFEASGLGPDLPLDHVEHYYQLSWRREADGAVAFTSSGLPADGWHRMAQHTAARVDLATLELEVVDLPQAARRAA
ncbi:class II glutamine amidotransferase [Agrococcus jejuensis]|uniref:Glutamine amidotransferase domain-containing protein n=1 Tax=Agrococcus jejuensis TaxID=399736 RepID=A0A1G8D098_9MICO|nr:class II glutamine amidotransferase [Agrococcus jejuensis]SDH51218.1 Glutamine amidotransferase domain-containing protein [Agrococcus jejuensis]